MYTIDLHVCGSLGQFDRYENISFDLVKKDKQFMEETTGCLYPCNYMGYKVLSKINIFVESYRIFSSDHRPRKPD